MKNIDIIAKATKEAGITSEVHTFIAWKKQGLSVRKGEKAALTVDLWKKHGSRWYQEPTALFTREQVQTEEERKRPIIETVKETIPDIVKEDLPAVNENQHFRVDGKKFHMTAEKGKVKATFSIDGIRSLAKADFQKFIKGYIEKADDREAVIAYLMENVNDEKKILLSGKDKIKKTDVSKALQVIGKADRVHWQVIDGKAYMTDGHMIVECASEDLKAFTSSKTEQYLKDHVFKNENLKGLMDKMFAYEGEYKDVDYSKALTEEFKIGKKKVKYYHPEDAAAVQKIYVDCFKDKVFTNVGTLKPIRKVTDTYRAAILPIKIS